MITKAFILIIIMFLYSDQKADEQSIRMEKGGLSNPQLSFTHPPEGWMGNKVNSQNQFMNIDTIPMPSGGDVLKWKLNKNPQKEEKKADTFQLRVVSDTSFLQKNNDVIVWLGHSTFYIRIDGISLITDPVFYDIPFVKRHHKLPFDPALITNLDYILVSHNHRDHCDKKSLKLLSRHNPEAVVLSGLEMDELIGKWIPNKIQVAGWFQKYDTDNLEIAFLPAQHWSKRGLTDTNKRLWGSFSIRIGAKRIYFGGDTGWGSHFSYIGNNFGPFDACMLPVGSYAPRWFMKSSHINPEEAIEGFKLLQAKKLYPMHYGTYDLSDEPFGEPLRVLKKEFYQKYNRQNLSTPSVGEVEQL